MNIGTQVLGDCNAAAHGPATTAERICSRWIHKLLPTMETLLLLRRKDFIAVGLLLGAHYGCCVLSSFVVVAAGT